MDAIDAILSRRSIRRFTNAAVSEPDLHTMLACAMAAPTAFNQQSWRFIVVTDACVRARLAEMSKNTAMLADAPLVVVVCGDVHAERHEGAFWIQDATAALENLLIAARALGLGAVWCAVHPMQHRVDAVRSILALPEGIEPLGMAGVGHPAESKPPAQRFDRDKVHFDRW